MFGFSVHIVDECYAWIGIPGLSGKAMAFWSYLSDPKFDLYLHRALGIVCVLGVRVKLPRRDCASLTDASLPSTPSPFHALQGSARGAPQTMVAGQFPGIPPCTIDIVYSKFGGTIPKCHSYARAMMRTTTSQLVSQGKRCEFGDRHLVASSI
jgi:hypothetical protein